MRRLNENNSVEEESHEIVEGKQGINTSGSKETWAFNILNG